MSPMRADLTTASGPDSEQNYAEQRLNFSSTFVTDSNSFYPLKKNHQNFHKSLNPFGRG